MTKSLIGQKIREIRTAKSWTQKDLANEAGCSRATIAAIELGYEKDPSATMLNKIAKALETSAEVLLSGKPDNSIHNHHRNPNDILHIFQLLNNRLFGFPLYEISFF